MLTWSVADIVTWTLESPVHCGWQVSCILMPPFTECGQGCGIGILCALCLASQLHTDPTIHRMWTWLRHHHHVWTVFGKSAAY